MDKEVQQVIAFSRLLTIVEAEYTGLILPQEYVKKLDEVMKGTSTKLTPAQIELINDIYEHNSGLLMGWLRARHEESKPKSFGSR